jgi:hypothetical protein
MPSQARLHPSPSDAQIRNSCWLGTHRLAHFFIEYQAAIAKLTSEFQGGQIMDDAMCGGGDPNMGIQSTAIPISSSVASKVKAIILMGDLRHTPGESYNVGTFTAPGVSLPRAVCLVLFLY